MVKSYIKETYFHSKTHAWVIILLSAILYTIGIQMFVQVAGTFSVGLGAFAQLFTITIHALKNYFSIIYLVINIPILIIFWKSLKKDFRIKTTIFLIIQAALGSLFLVPEIKDLMIGSIGFTPNKTVSISRIRSEVWPIIVLAMLGGIFVGASTSIAWKKGGSTAGSDIIVYYFSTKKKKPVGTIMLLISLIIMSFSFSVSLIVESSSRKHWLIIMVSTMAYVLITSAMVNMFYPKYSKVKIEIHSDKSKEIIDYLSSDKYNHSFQWVRHTSGYTKRDKNIIITVMLLLEVKTVVKELIKIDERIWILETNVRRVTGSFDTTKVD